MILVDTSVWIGHFRQSDPALVQRLENGEVLGHEWVTGELALGNLPQWTTTVKLLSNLPQATLGTGLEVMAFIEDAKLSGLGIGYVDVNLLVSTLLTSDARLWTLDKRLNAVAGDLGVPTV